MGGHWAFGDKLRLDEGFLPVWLKFDVAPFEIFGVGEGYDSGQNTHHPMNQNYMCLY